MTLSARDVRAKTQPRRGLRRVEAATYIGISDTKFDQLVADGRMPPPKRIDTVVVWDQDELDIAFSSLPHGQEFPAVPEAKPETWD